ncbi:MAG: zinc ribbon domain-containing protein [Acidobacteriota bacterium]
MYCPDCGAENVKSQKFCVRCGSNLLVVDRAREIVGEESHNSGSSEGHSPQLLRMIALISVCGFVCVTMGTIFLALIDRGHTRTPVVFGVGGFLSIILICRYLLRMTLPSRWSNPLERKILSPPLVQPVARIATNRGLSASAVPFQSVTEDSTRQFEKER